MKFNIPYTITNLEDDSVGLVNNNFKALELIIKELIKEIKELEEKIEVIE